MKRENIEGMIRTALVTHHAKHGVMLPAVDEYIGRLADAIEAQQKREADASLNAAIDAVLAERTVSFP